MKVYKHSKDEPKPFKFFYFLAYKPEFVEIVEGNWTANIHEHNMFKLVKKMSLLKKPFRKLLRSKGNLHDWVARLRHELYEVL